ncbi:MAG: type II toxin-antitoxin system VapC family toxin [Propionibacteriaceae bacterium]|nr:type II toxin-antitoxin system VapC family toxin [Propionibacteriaceae bacterium]
MIVYIDTSAFLRGLLSNSSDHQACRDLVHGTQGNELVSSEVLRLEARRVGIRLANKVHGGVDPRPGIEAMLTRVSLVRLSDAILSSAESIPETLKSLDALHLATALAIQSDVAALVTYDLAMARVAEAHGLRVCTASELLGRQ